MFPRKSAGWLAIQTIHDHAQLMFNTLKLRLTDSIIGQQIMDGLPWRKVHSNKFQQFRTRFIVWN